MQNNLIHVGLDVDDSNYHGSAFNKATGEVIDFQCRPTLKGLLNQLDKLRKHFAEHVIKLCYEASYVGFTLQRDLTEKGFHCEVVAPNSIPRLQGKHIKTDRLDAIDLARYYANGLLTLVAVPEREQEQDRDLLRSRHKIMVHQSDVRRHIHSLLRRNGLHFKEQTRFKSHWTKAHYFWLDKVLVEATGRFKINLALVLRELRSIDAILAEYQEQIDVLANSVRYQSTVKALTCYKGIQNIFAMTMITEIGDIKRFPHPRQLVSWMGMDIWEYSSGGKHNRFGLTKQGNAHLRTAFIEANQRSYRSRQVSDDLKARRKNTHPELVQIAERCLTRVNKKGNHLLEVGKHPNKVKVACAREMVGFVWESLNKAAA